MKKQNASLIAKMLNKNSQPEQKTAAEEILMLDARELVPNPKNIVWRILSSWLQ